MKANRKFVEARENAGVSAVIGVILMVAITVAIAATVYMYASGMVSNMTSQSSKVVPQIQFMQSGDTLIVQKTPKNVEWQNVTVSGGTPPYTDTTKVAVGQSITGCSGSVTITYNGELAGIYQFG